MTIKCKTAAAETKECQTSWYPKIFGDSFGNFKPKPTAPTMYSAIPTIMRTLFATVNNSNIVKRYGRMTRLMHT